MTINGLQNFMVMVKWQICVDNTTLIPQLKELYVITLGKISDFFGLRIKGQGHLNQTYQNSCQKPSRKCLKLTRTFLLFLLKINCWTPNNLYFFIDITAIRGHTALKFTVMFCIIITNIFLQQKINFRR